MSVLIKGMEMPKSCDECRIMVFEDTNCVSELFCGCPIVFEAHPQGVGHRPDYCPLIEVPEDVQHVKHGKWIWDDEGYHCSECFFHAYDNSFEIMQGIWNYCPHCGARVDGGDA